MKEKKKDVNTINQSMGNVLNCNQENERSLKEVFTVKDYEKLLPIIEYLENNEKITTQKAEELTGKSSATAWRYLKKLNDIGVLKADGNTNNAIYKRY